MLVDGVNVGPLTVDVTGKGKLKLKSNPDVDEVGLPGNFPNVSEGSTILVQGLMQGTFGAAISGVVGGEGVTEGEFAATLTGDGQGTASYSVKVDSNVEREFEIEVQDAVTGSYSVLVAGVNVGTIEVDAEGEGKLKLSTDPRFDHGELLMPHNFPDVANGVTVAIDGLVSGTFAEVVVV